jgi:hypothetical protein
VGQGTRVLVFARAPVAGRCKSRLIPALGAEGAAELHARLVTRTVATAVEAHPGGVELWCEPDVDHPFFAGLARRFGVELERQRGEGLGERMSSALRAALECTEGAVLIGSDCADLTGADLHAALAALGGGADAVLGPVLDGGYWLVGLRRWAASPFEDISWGGPRVLEETRAAFAGLGWRWEELPARRDVDRPEDLQALEPGLLAGLP